MQTSCGQCFCRKCIRGQTRSSLIVISLYTSHASNYNDRRVCNFKVKCHNKGGGCKWQGNLGYVKTHAQYNDANCESDREMQTIYKLYVYVCLVCAYEYHVAVVVMILVCVHVCGVWFGACYKRPAALYTYPRQPIGKILSSKYTIN